MHLREFYSREILVSTQELVNTIREIQKVSNSVTNDPQVLEIINQFDHDKDGFIEADEILKVKQNKGRFRSSTLFFFVVSLQALEIIGNERVNISKKHLKEIIDVVRKEQIVEEKEKKEELVAKAKQPPVASANKST